MPRAVVKKGAHKSRKISRARALLVNNPDTGQRHVQVTAAKTKADYAQFLDWPVHTHYPDAQKIKLVQDSYSTHRYGAF